MNPRRLHLLLVLYGSICALAAACGGGELPPAPARHDAGSTDAPRAAVDSSAPAPGDPDMPGPLPADAGPAPQDPPTPPMMNPPPPPSSPAGGAALDAFGGIHTFGGFVLDTTGAPDFMRRDVARSLAVIPDGSGGWVLDNAGGVHPFGRAMPLPVGPYWPGSDNARAFVVTRDHAGYWVMEASGAITAVGSATPLPPNPSWPGTQIAVGFDLHYDAAGHADGGWLLDAWGGVHEFGAAPAYHNDAALPWYAAWHRLHAVEGGLYLVGRWGIMQPVGSPVGVPFDGIFDVSIYDGVRDVAIANAPAGSTFDTSRALRCPDLPSAHWCTFANGNLRGAPNYLYHCAAAGAPPDGVEYCEYGCLAPFGIGVCAPPPPPPPPPTGLSCGSLQWWNSRITWQHYLSGGWLDTDLAVPASTPVALRHDSRLDRTGVYDWGYMPEFTDLVTGVRFKILHLRPSAQNATEVGRVYPAGFIVGLSGGDSRDTGYPTYSTGAHLCINTLVPYRDAFPEGGDACL